MKNKNPLTMTDKEYKEYQLICQKCGLLRIDCCCEEDICQDCGTPNNNCYCDKEY